MIARYLIDCRCERPDWPFMPVSVACGSARTIGVIGLRSRLGITVTGCKIRVTNADGCALTIDCVLTGGIWVATFPASHFQSYGTVKNGVVVFATGRDEHDDDQMWIERVGDLRVTPVDAESTPGVSSAPKDVYLKSYIAPDGVQHYKKCVLVYSERQNAWGEDYVGDYIFVGGDYVPFSEG